MFFNHLKRTNRILTLLTSPNFPILLVHATVLYHNATKGEGFDSAGFYLNGCITVASSGNTFVFWGERCVGLLPMFLQNSH